MDFNSLLFETVARFFIALRQYTQQCTITFDLDALEEIPFILPGQEENDDDRQVAAVEQRRFQQLLPSVNLSSNLKDTISYYNVNRYMTHMVDMLESRNSCSFTL